SIRPAFHDARGLHRTPARATRRLDRDARRLPGGPPDIPRMVEDAIVTDAREEILGRVRDALGDVALRRDAARPPVDRNYLRTDPASREVRIERFLERVAEYKAEVRRVSGSELPGAI